MHTNNFCKKVITLGLAVVASLQANQLRAACVTQFDNESNFQWTLSGFAGPQSSLMIAPHSTQPIKWGSATKIVVSGAIPNRQYTRQFQVTADSNGCYVIEHQGNVGNVTLNKPGNGDIVTCTGGC